MEKLPLPSNVPVVFVLHCARGVARLVELNPNEAPCPQFLPEPESCRLLPEIMVTSNTPPAFLCQTEDDGVHAENSLYYYLALKNVKVPVEMHLFAKGGHGYGLIPFSIS